MSKVLIDTNILVYCLDGADQGKQKRCRELITALTAENRGVLSTQVLQEFYVASTTKLGADPLIVKDIIRSLDRFETVVITPVLIKEAIDCSLINRLSFGDALIVVAAESAKCGLLWTADLSNGQIIRGVRIENPIESMS